MVDVLPRQLADVDQAVHAAEIDEGAEGDDRRHGALADLADLQVVEEAVTGLLLGLLQIGPTRQHDVVAVLVEFDDLRLHGGADVRLQVAHSAQFDERCGQEATQADVDDQAALDDLDDRTLDDLVGFLLGLDVAPRTLVLRTLLGQDETAFLVFLREHERLDRVAQADDLGRVDVVADAQLAARDHTLALVPDVEQHLVLVDLDDGAVHQFAVLDLDDRAVDGVGEAHAEIVGDDLTRGVVAFVVERPEVGIDGGLGGSGIGQGTDCFRNGH